ncbi:ATP-binding protein [Mycobacterium sp. NPDC006124]|uniref:ATP-binding protein n=1 Tax=Mycobacterium sp. NPDC006124 TaxID=3156729 RepID=UPI0033B7A747
MRAPVGTSTQLHRTRRSDAVEASRLRQDLDAWLHQSDVPLTQSRCADVLLGVNEALANCAEHAYHGRHGGDITIHAHYDGGHRLRVRISDRGRWRPSPAVALNRRGRGLALMRALSDQCTVDRRHDGTTVRLDYDLSGDTAE